MFEGYESIEDVDRDSPAYKLEQQFIEFGLSPNETKTYIYLLKNDSKKALEISRALNIPRTECYHLLSSLQNKGLVTATFHHPIKFNAVSFEKALKLLINTEKEKIKNLERKKEALVTLSNLLPEVKTYTKSAEKENFQILKGHIRIFSKAEDMLSRARQEVLVLGNERDYLRFFHFDFMDTFKRSIDARLEVKFLTDQFQNSFEVFHGIRLERIRQMQNDVDFPLSFLLIDRSELLFFMSDDTVMNKDRIALWTDSKPFVTAIHMLFCGLWKDSIQLQQAIDQDQKC